MGNFMDRCRRALGGFVRLFNPLEWRRRGIVAGTVSALLAIAILLGAVGWWWSLEPDTFDVEQHATAVAEANGQERVVGYTTTVTLMRATETLLEKPGGYLFNDVTPPSVFLDNMPSWEYGALVQIRDLARTMRNEISRSQSQSRENEDLSQAEPRLNFDANSWLFPSTEGEYRAALDYLASYRDQLADPDRSGAQFYARADNLREWLSIVEKRLGGIAQRLGASVGEWRANIDLAGEPAARQSTPTGADTAEQTPWLEIDDEFYHARGATWALLHFLRAVQIDFENVLADKNAERSVEQIIRALEATQRPMGSPVVLNGNGFGVLANHSLVMASYVSRANAGIIDLRRLLEQG
jgi:hypothetical protein